MDWKRIFIGEEPAVFFLEVLFRTVIMFVVVLVALRVSGKREMRQLSVFDMAIIIALGSAAGDPMFYKDVSLLQAAVVFAGVFLVYHAIVYLISRSEKAEDFVEGKPFYIIKNGVASHEYLESKPFGADEFFAELRGKQITHLGQIRRALLETNGEISILFYEDEEVRPGLPIWPELFRQQLKDVREPGVYACSRCGCIKSFPTTDPSHCSHCDHEVWVKAISARRVP